MPLFNKNIEHELLNIRLKDNKSMTELQFFAAELTAWEHSAARLEMLDGNRYYAGDHDILRRKRMAIGKDGEKVEVKNLPNTKIVDNQYAKHVDQKKNYLLGKPIIPLTVTQCPAVKVKLEKLTFAKARPIFVFYLTLRTLGKRETE